MSQQATTITLQNEEKVNQLAFALAERSKPTMALITYDTIHLRDHIYDQLKGLMTYNDWIDISLAGENVDSFFDTLKKQLGDRQIKESRPSTLVNVFGLENSLIQFQAGKLVPSGLLDSMNFERELFFRDLPFTTLIWADDYFLKQIGWRAPDLWDWITYVFEFQTPEKEIETKVSPSQAPVTKKGNIHERNERIKELEAKLTHIPVKNQSKRNLKDRINLLQLLGQEYYEQFAFEQAIEHLQVALNLAQKLPGNGHQLAHLHFLLGDNFLALGNFEKALAHYNWCLEKADNKNKGRVYHQIGMVYEEQEKWAEALRHYQKAIDWKVEVGDNSGLESTYHQIGTVYQKQNKLLDSLAYYQKAIDFSENSGNEFHVGASYHQIARLYEEKNKLSEALTYYRKAIDFLQKSGNEFEVGNSYHQIGRVYQKQRNWAEALAHYQKAIDFYKATGNEFELDASYHQMGKVYEEKAELETAKTYYQKAQSWAKQFNNQVALELIESSLARLNDQLGASHPEAGD